MERLKKILPDIIAVLLFAVMAFVYFYPADIEGRILYQHDASAGRGAGQEIQEYRKAHDGETPRWTNTLFSGMPTYQMAPSYNSSDKLSLVRKAYQLWLPEAVQLVFIYLLGFYIMLRAFDYRHSLAVLGSIIWAFSSYFFIIIAAGHIWKVFALAYLPPLIGGVVLAYRGKYLASLALTALFAALEINANHVQMTYYYMFIIGFIMLAYLVDDIRKKRLAHFAKATAVCLAGAVIGVCVNLSNLYHTWQYSQESMRGKSELVKADAANQSATGLERDYITQWSYGIGETWTLLIPNTKGGSSTDVMAKSEAAMKKADPAFAQTGIYGSIGQYWGEQPFTSGPVYAGAFVMMLFVLGLFIVKGPMKWALLASTILSVLLSWGHNFMWFSDLFIDYMPMYSKFRTVSSILVIAEFTIPLLAVMALKRVVDDPDLLTRKIKWVYVSFALTAGMALLFAVLPDLFFSNFISSREMARLTQAIPQDYIQPLVSNLTEMRKAIFTADCWRTFLIIVAGTAVLLLLKARKLNATVAVTAIAVLCLCDMWTVNKRYLHDDMFVSRSVREKPVEMTDAEKMILEDSDPHFRVLNMASDTFNENETSYYLNSIGGYHAAKLRRYQEMVERYIHPQMGSAMNAIIQSGGMLDADSCCSSFPVINMLNTKYFIVGLQNGGTVPVANPSAMGNAWFVDKVDYVGNANEEIDAVGAIDLRHTAVADKRFSAALGSSTAQDSTSTAVLTAVDADKLNYDVSTRTGGVLVFSEVYYPGWKATVDGEEVEMGRVNYLLRAINVKPGNHKVELTFHPSSVKVTESIAYISYALIAAVFAMLFYSMWRKRKAAPAE